jgi:TPR repeat protein
MEFRRILAALVCALAGELLAGGIVHMPQRDASAEYERLARNGSVRAQKVLGALCAERGDGCASYWLRRAASAGDCEAQAALADFVADRDPAEAVLWYARAADRTPDAAWKLGRMYENGEGVAQNPARALELYKAAAERGSGGAMNSLGNLSLLRGDYAGALGWYRKAADAGFGEALLNLAGMYYQGLGVARDVGIAYRFAEQAGNLKVRDAAAFVAEIRSAMSR